MQRLENLIEISREDTENEEFSDTIGIKDTQFIRWFNSAQEKIQSLIAQKHQRIFVVEQPKFSITPRQEEYDLPFDIYLDNRITQIEFSSSGRDDDFFALDQGTMKERNSITFGIPARYIRRGGKFLLAPIPDGVPGQIRISYVKRLPKIDIRRATISSVSTSGNTITTLIISLSSDDKTIIDKQFPFFSVVNAEGDQQMRRIKYTNIDQGTGIVTIDPSFIFENGETITTSDFLVAGPDTANRPDTLLPEMTERFLVEFMNWKAQKKDSSNDAGPMSQELVDMLNEIIETFADTDDDIIGIPEINREIDILGPL